MKIGMYHLILSASKIVQMMTFGSPGKVKYRKMLEYKISWKFWKMLALNLIHMGS